MWSTANKNMLFLLKPQHEWNVPTQSKTLPIGDLQVCSQVVSNRWQVPCFPVSCKFSVETKKHVFVHQMSFCAKKTLEGKLYFFILKESMYLYVKVTNQFNENELSLWAILGTFGVVYCLLIYISSEKRCKIWAISNDIKLMIHQKNCIVMGISMIPTFCIFSDLYSNYGTKQSLLCCSLLVCMTSKEHCCTYLSCINVLIECMISVMWRVCTFIDIM